MGRWGRISVLGLAAAMGAPAVSADEIQRACLGSPRAAGNQTLCACLQAAANRTLTPGDQRRVSRFFRDPDQAETTRMSRSAADDAFWERYEAFADLAESFCAPE